MAKVTSKLQVTIPKRIADHYGIKPGDEIEWVEAGDSIRVVPAGRDPEPVDVERRLELFDATTERLREYHAGRTDLKGGRDWTREDLYTRGMPRHEPDSRGRAA